MPKTIDVDQARAEFANVQHVRVETRDGEVIADLADKGNVFGMPIYSGNECETLRSAERVYRLAAWAEEYGPALLEMARKGEAAK